MNGVGDCGGNGGGSKSFTGGFMVGDGGGGNTVGVRGEGIVIGGAGTIVGICGGGIVIGGVGGEPRSKMLTKNKAKLNTSSGRNAGGGAVDMVI
ncbi:hypothetical protein SOVF_154080 [Spinacia oleracea]|nr:hypothetical protein SOVF_154080 [Spinacia oleracea]